MTNAMGFITAWAALVCECQATMHIKTDSLLAVVLAVQWVLWWQANVSAPMASTRMAQG